MCLLAIEAYKNALKTLFNIENTKTEKKVENIKIILDIGGEIIVYLFYKRVEMR